MSALIQNVRNICGEVKSQVTEYLCGLLLHDNRKTCSWTARKIDVPVKRMYSTFKQAHEKVLLIKEDLRNIAQEIESLGENRVLAIDGTMIRKAFARRIEGMAFDYDGVIRCTAQGLSIIVASLIIGGDVIPLDVSFWRNPKKKNGKRVKNDPEYRTKISLAIQLITTLKQLMTFDFVAMDGAFASEAMISFLESEGL